MLHIWCSLEINTLWPSDTIWLHISWSAVAQVMACCLTAPLPEPMFILNNHQIISEVLWHSPEHNFTGNAHDICTWYMRLKISNLRLQAHPPGAQWVKNILIDDKSFIAGHQQRNWIPQRQIQRTKHKTYLWVNLQVCQIFWWRKFFIAVVQWVYEKGMYCQISNISHTLIDNKIVDHSHVVGASPVGAAPTTSSFST